MLINISWFQYWKFIVYMLIGYYIVIICIYYYKSIYLVATGKKKLDFNVSKLKRKNSLQKGDINKSQQSIIEKQELPAGLATIIDKITNTLYKAGGRRLEKPELFYTIQQVLHTNNFQLEPSYKPVISEYIKKATISYCSVHFSDDDLEELWHV